ncbi:MAG: hypothetical protein ACQSGP_15715 [Frankia sp.]
MVTYGGTRVGGERCARAGRRLAVVMLAVAAMAAGCGGSSGGGSSPGAAGGSGGATASGGLNGSTAAGPSAGVSSGGRASGSATATAPTDAGASSTASVDCHSVISTSAAPSAGRSIILGAVALPGYQQVPATASGSADPAARLFAKIGLQVRAGTTVELAVPSALTSRARIGWGSGAGPSASVRVSCPTGTGSPGQPWVTFAGGFYASSPFCLPLVVRTPSAVASVTIGIGTSCRQSGPVR